MKSPRVKVGNATVTIHRWKSAWRFVHRDDSGARRYVTASTLEGAKRKAVDVLTTLGGDGWETLTASRQAFLLGLHALIPAGDEKIIVDYLRGRGQSISTPQAVASYANYRQGKARSIYYESMLMRDLEHLAAAFPGMVRDISAEMLRDWHAARCEGTGSARHNAVRSCATGFFKWCRREGIIGNDAITAADRLPTSQKDKGQKVILTREEFEKLLVHIPARHRVWVLLGGLAGLRPEEIAPKAGKLADGRRGLHWEDIDFTFNQIRIAADVSKIDCARLVPMCPALAAELLPLRAFGPVAVLNPVEDKTLRDMGRKVFGGAWPKDALRHSYGSYRNAILRNLPQVAEEMGTSVAMLHRHYHNPQPEHLGQAWFESLKSHKSPTKKDAAIPENSASIA